MPADDRRRDLALVELMRSPLDDEPRRRPAARVWIPALVAAAATAGAAALIVGGGAGETAAPGTTVATEQVLTTVPGVPAATSFSELTHDPDSGWMILTGGAVVGGRRFAVEELGDGTWAFDPQDAEWGRLDGQGPPPRIGHGAAIDPIAGVLVVFGGSGTADVLTCANSGLCAPEPLGDTWMLDLATGSWSEIDGSGPLPRYGTAMTYDPGLQRIVLFGGAIPEDPRRNFFLGDTWSFDSSARRWERLLPRTAPPPRAWHRLVYDPDGRRAVLVGGVGDAADTAWAFDGALGGSWIELGPSGPGALWGIATAADANGVLFAIGGGGLVARPTGPGTITEFTLSPDVWISERDTWRQIEGLPEGRAGGSAAYDPASGRVVAVFGGTVGLLDPASGSWEWVDGTGADE